jgi:serine/threonine protein kinase
MITVTKGKYYVSYDKIKDPHNYLILYPALFSGNILKTILSGIIHKDRSVFSTISVGLSEITKKRFTPIPPQQHYFGAIAHVFLEDVDIQAKPLESDGADPLQIKCKKGSLAIVGSVFRNKWDFTLPKSVISYFEENYLPDIYTNTKYRVDYKNLVFSNLENIRTLPQGDQCYDSFDYMNLSIIGSGSYGNVFKGHIDSLQFAVKFSKLTPEALENPYSLGYISWREVFFLKHIFNPLIVDNVCPNLPLLYDSFICKNYKLQFKNNSEEHPCVITMVELANGDFKQYLKLPELSKDPDLIFTALFQIMAALSAIQKYGQIIHFDIKKENILYYKITPGGYFTYTILGKTFYIPNKGYLFILNDFGISRSVSPKYIMYRNSQEHSFRLGSRYARIDSSYSPPKFVPIDISKESTDDGKIIKSNTVTWIDKNGVCFSSMGAVFRIDRLTGKVSPSKQQGVSFSSDFFEKPEEIPPFEFYNDTQDVLRIFTGGKRATQEGYHKKPLTVSKKITNLLTQYAGPSESLKEGKYSGDDPNPENFGKFSTDPCQILASYFITDFFQKYTSYSQTPEGNIIQSYHI